MRIIDPTLRHLERTFTYASDEPLPVGALVRVSFHGRLRNALVVGEGEPFDKAKPIQARLGPGLPGWMVGFASTLAEATLTDVGAVLAAMLPVRVASEEPKVPADPLPLGDIDPGPPAPFLLGALAPPGRVLFAPGLASDVTEALAKLVRDDLSAGGRVLVVLPEADRRSTTASRLLEVGGDSAAWLGSDVSDRLRYRAWLRLRRGVARLAIGGRGAILAPIEPTLIVVVDEANAAHKEGRAPRFHVREVAKLLAEHHGARLLLVGTPPSIESRLDADPRRGALTLVQTPIGIKTDVRVLEPAGLVPAPVTMRLLDAVDERICVLVHRSEHLRPASERLQRHLSRSVVTIDAGSDPSLEATARAADGPAIVVATAAIASDHPILGVSTLVIVGADAALASPGFRAAEEVVASWWRLINATRPQRVLVESRDRSHHAIDALVKLDHDRFARAEAEARHALGYPPYRNLVRFSIAEADAERLLADLAGRSILGPMTDPTDAGARVIAVRGDNRLVDDLTPLVHAWRSDGVRVKVDVDPWDLVEERWRS